MHGPLRLGQTPAQGRALSVRNLRTAVVLPRATSAEVIVDARRALFPAGDQTSSPYHNQAGPSHADSVVPSTTTAKNDLAKTMVWAPGEEFPAAIRSSSPAALSQSGFDCNSSAAWNVSSLGEKLLCGQVLVYMNG